MGGVFRFISCRGGHDVATYCLKQAEFAPSRTCLTKTPCLPLLHVLPAYCILLCPTTCSPADGYARAATQGAELMVLST